MCTMCAAARKSGEGRRQSASTGGEEQRVLRRKKRVAAQLETFAEFVEYHLGEEREEGEEEVGEALRQQVQGQEQGGAYDGVAEYGC